MTFSMVLEKPQYKRWSMVLISSTNYKGLQPKRFNASTSSQRHSASMIEPLCVQTPDMQPTKVLPTNKTFCHLEYKSLTQLHEAPWQYAKSVSVSTFTITVAISFPRHNPSTHCMHKNRQRDVKLHFVHVSVLSCVVGRSVHCFVGWLTGCLTTTTLQCTPQDGSSTLL
jgi:hypothetical protein